MNSDSLLQNLNDCGCCEGITVHTPVAIDNRPGLTAIAYRVGTHVKFKQSMLARLSAYPELAGLKTRDDDDFSIALLDAWAMVADVLTFYQERIANESYLRTANERRSILELARLIGYELRPGVAASTYLAFMLEDAQGAPRQTVIDIGTKVQSVPGPGEKPQTFETIEKIEARVEWNALKVKTTELITPQFGHTTVYLKGTATNLKAGDALLFVGEEREQDPGSERWDFRRVKTVTTDDKAGHTIVKLDRGLGSVSPLVLPATNSKVYALRQRANLFGHNAPDWRTMPDNVKVGHLKPGGLYAEYFDNKNLTNLKVTRIDPVVDFDWGTGSPDPAIESDTFSARWTGFVKPTASEVYTFYTRSDDGVRLWVDGKLILNNWTDHPPTENSGTITLSAEKVYPIILEYYESGGGATIRLSWSRPGLPKEVISSNRLYAMSPDEWPGFSMTEIGTRRGLYAEYFDNINLTNQKVTRIDPQVNFNWGAGSPDPAIASDTFSARWTGLLKPMSSGVYTFYTVSDDGVRLWVNGHLIIDNWTDHPPTENSGTITLTAGQAYDTRLEYYERGGGATIRLSWSGPGLLKEIIPQSQLFPPDIYLDAIYSQILQSSWLVLSIPNYQELYQIESVAEASQTNFTLTAKTTRATLKGENLRLFDHKLRETVVFAQSEKLEIAEQPITTPVSGNEVVLNQKIEGLFIGRLLAISGVDNNTGETISEVMKLKPTEPVGNFTKLVFTSNLQNTYRGDSVTINANVARATHGETVQEVLGSGDASQPFQKFTLKQPPLTYISASTPSGVESTLKVRVNDILWQEVTSLYGRGSRDRVYITKTDDEGKTTVQFGDGITGTRLPTGQNNIQVTYRKGIGIEGNAKAEQLTMLLTRPLGVKGVTNPLAANGGDDRESLADARRNAPLTVLTLERAVSLKDYEDFACAFAGISKALATWVWDGKRYSVFITVAGPKGAAIEEKSQTYENLLTALQKSGDPYVKISIKSYKKTFFKIAGNIKVSSDYQPEKVLESVKQELRTRFSFDARDFGQPVMLSEVIAIIQAVQGVEMVDVDKLYRVGESEILNHRLTVDMPEMGENGEMIAGELLMLDPAPIELGVVS
jgi:hypothetical protein